MLGKMLIHGLVAAVVVASAAAVYAQVKDNGYLSPGAIPEQRQDVVAGEPGKTPLRPAGTNVNVRGREADERHAVRSERHRERHDRKRAHDDDDD